MAINAVHLDRVPDFDFDYSKHWGERTLRPVANVTRRDVREFLQLAADIPVRTEIEVHPLLKTNEALTRLSEGQVGGAAVLSVR